MGVTPAAELRIHEGRGLVGYTDAEGESEGWPEVAYEAVRSINHLTQGGPIPAPTVYEVLGNLKGVGHLLPQALSQLGQGLAQSLDDFEVYDRSGDPAQSVANARAYLAEAAEHAQQLGLALEAAQSAISAQGFTTEEDEA